MAQQYRKRQQQYEHQRWRRQRRRQRLLHRLLFVTLLCLGLLALRLSGAQPLEVDLEDLGVRVVGAEDRLGGARRLKQQALRIVQLPLSLRGAQREEKAAATRAE